MRTLLICALAATQVGCSSQPLTQPSCHGLNPLACLTAVDVPIEPVASDSGAAKARVSTAAARDIARPRPADHAIRRVPAPKPVNVATSAVPIPVSSPHAGQQTTPASGTSDTAPPETTGALPDRTTRQVAASSAPDASPDAQVAILLTGPDVRSVDQLAGKTIAIDDRYSDASIRSVRYAMVAAGAPEVQISKGQSTAISRLVGNEVSAAVVGLVPANSTESFPELARLKTFRVPLSPRSAKKQ